MAPSKELEPGSPTGGGPPPTDKTNTSNASTNAASSEPQVSSNDFAQAYREITRGEQAATALEANLSKLESKLDELLAGFTDPESLRAQLAALDTGDSEPVGSNREKNTKNTEEESNNGPSKGADAGGAQ